MSEQKLVPQTEERPLLPRQPELNIGTAGHVDHGKCLTPDQIVLLEGRLQTGYEILSRLTTEAVQERIVDGGTAYELKGNRVVSMNKELEPVEARSTLFVQGYFGKVFAVRTWTGRSITVTPEHPLFINRMGSLMWAKAKELEPSDQVAFVRHIPLPTGVEFPSPVERLREHYVVVTWQDSQRLNELTEGFKTFNAVMGADFDVLRVMARISKGIISKKLGLSLEKVNSILSGKEAPGRHFDRLSSVLRSPTIRPLHPGELLMEPRLKARWGPKLIREPDFDDDLVKWFAFVLAEGGIRERSLAVTQKVQMRMLSEFFEINRKKFGTEFKKVSEIDYRLNSRAMIDYLRFRFSVEVGAKRGATLPGWVLGLSPSQRGLFLRWFFTLDGEFNEKAGQISITQVNHKSVITIGYLLGSMGVVPRFDVKSVRTQRGIMEYHRITISGRRDLRAFADAVGFEDDEIQSRLSRYLARISRRSKETDLSIAIDRKALRELLQGIGVIREGFRQAGETKVLKRTPFYKAFEGARYTNRMSRSKLLALVSFTESHATKLAKEKDRRRIGPSDVLRLMSLAGISQGDVAARLGMTRRGFSARLRRDDRATIRSAAKLVRDKAEDALKSMLPRVRELKRLLNSPLEFDSISSIVTHDYSGPIFDLSVPKHENFIAGNGAIVCHNTTLTQAVTGVWASAHSEELKRGITIKVGYADAAFYKCSHTPVPAAYSTSSKCPVCGRETKLLRVVSFVDSPGHESLMTNMLAGAFLMDGAVLVIAANEPVPKPQTREHLQALNMLGMKKIVVAQNKVDLVTDAEAKRNYSQIEKFVANTVAEDAPIIPISAQQRLNIDALIEAMEDTIPTPKRDPKADPLMYVVRSFDVNRPGAEIEGLSGGVLGGSLTRGEMRVGDEVELKPGMVDERSGKYVPVVTEISSLQTGAGRTEKVGPGGLVAVGTHLDPTFIKGDQMVGSVIGKPGTLPQTWEHLTLAVDLLDTAVGSADLVKVEKVKLGEGVRLNLGTASALATVSSARSDTIEVDLKKPVAIELGMRAALSRRIAERWRLIGSGVLK